MFVQYVLVLYFFFLHFIFFLFCYCFTFFIGISVCAKTQYCWPDRLGFCVILVFCYFSLSLSLFVSSAASAYVWKFSYFVVQYTYRTQSPIQNISNACKAIDSLGVFFLFCFLFYFMIYKYKLYFYFPNSEDIFD